MANIFNFGQKGIGSLVNFGKRGPRIEDTGIDGRIRLGTASGYNVVESRGADAVMDDAFMTKGQMDARFKSDLINVITTEVSYSDTTVEMFELPANSLLFSVSVEVPSVWTNANGVTSISVGDESATDNLFDQGEADLTRAETFLSTYRKEYSQSANISATINAGTATSGTAKIVCTVLTEDVSTKNYVADISGEGIVTYLAPDPVISGTNNNTVVRSGNGTAITSAGSSYVSLQNLPDYLNDKPMVTDINNGTVSWNIPATTVYMIKNTEWNTVSTTGWTLVDGDADVLTDQSSGSVEIYSKQFTPGIYNFDDDSAIYVFDYSTSYTPATEVIDSTTEINIFFDSSGSMDTTLAPLETMRDTVLRTALEPFYNNDSAAYDAAVTITSIPTERVFDQLATMGSTNATRVINLVFADENSPYGATTSYPTSPNSTLSGDISALRSAVSSANSEHTPSYYRSVLFQVNTGPDYFTGFKQMTQSVYNGAGNYSGTAGVSDFNETQMFLINDVVAGSTPTFYADQIIAGLNSLGYDLTPLSSPAPAPAPEPEPEPAPAATWVVVGAQYGGSSSNGDTTGATYVYDATDLSAQPTRLIASDGIGGDRFGHSVAATADKIVIGAHNDDDNGSSSGSVYVYDANNLSSQPTKLTAFDGAASDEFGSAVAATSDKIIVGAHKDDSNSGAVYAYDANDLSAAPTKLTAFDAISGDRFGYSVAATADKIVIGAFLDDDDGSASGSVYVYDATDLSAQPTKLTAFDATASDYFGRSVAATADQIIVGAMGDDDNGLSSGSVYVYDANNLSATPTKLTAFDGAVTDQFSLSVAATADKIVIGAHGDDDNGSSSGSVYVYDATDLSAQPTKLTAFDGAGGDQFGYSVAVEFDVILVSAHSNDDNGLTNSGAVYAYDANDLSAAPTKLTAFDATAHLNFGNGNKAVAIG